MAQINTVRELMRVRDVEIGILPFEHELRVKPMDVAIFDSGHVWRETWPDVQVTSSKHDLAQARGNIESLTADALWEADADRFLADLVAQVSGGVDLRNAHR